jgi:hypothetical protein
MSVGYWETLAVLKASGTALTAAARASLTQGANATGFRYTMPGNRLRIGDVLRLDASGRISSLITTPGTARFDLSMGGTAIMDSLAILLDSVAAHTNVLWVLEMQGTVVADGTTANMQWWGKWTCEDILGVPATAPKGVLTAMLPWNTPPTVSANFDSTVSQLIDLQFTQTVATGSCQLHTAELSLKSSTGF